MSKFSAEDRKKNEEEFYLEMGRATVRWSQIESGLVQWFQRLTKMNRMIARRIFYSASGFDGRRKMLLQAIGSVKTEPDISEYIRLLITKAGNYSGSRNRMAHGDMFFVDYEGSKHYGQHIILEGSEQWRADPPDEAVLTLKELKTMSDNFGRLAAFIVDSLNWTGDKAKLPSRWTEIVRLLPTPAHSGLLDPTIAAQIQLDDKLPFDR